MTNLAFRKSIRILLASVALCSFAGRAVAQNRSPVAPSEEALQNTLREAYTKFKNDTNGKNSDYIPYLAQVDSNLYGIAIVTTDGRIYKIGDVDYAFSITVYIQGLHASPGDTGAGGGAGLQENRRRTHRSPI